jgi:hypothetical protein
MDELKSFAEIPYPPKEPVKPVQRRPVYNPHTIEKGTTTQWEPIDLNAAKMLMASPWYCKSPQPKPVMKDEKQRPPESGGIYTPQPKKYVSDEGISVENRLGPEGYVTELIASDSVSQPAVEAHEKVMKQRMAGLENLEERINEIHAAIQHSCKALKEPEEELRTLLQDALINLREKRFGIGSEIRNLLNNLRELRAFFLGPDHSAEVERLKEFVDLCERLQKLKESGFLDVVADTLIKLT